MFETKVNYADIIDYARGAALDPGYRYHVEALKDANLSVLVTLQQRCDGEWVTLRHAMYQAVFDSASPESAWLGVADTCADLWKRHRMEQVMKDLTGYYGPGEGQ